jgi:transposase-like protein
MEDNVAVAYSNPGSIKATARTYGVQAKDIRYWAKTLKGARNVFVTIKMDCSRGAGFPSTI